MYHDYKLFTDEEKWKMEADLWELSKEFSGEPDLLDVAIKGLKIRSSKVEKYINGSKHDINRAAYNVFREWLNTQEDLEAARDKMNKALEKTEEKQYFKTSFNQT